MALLILKLWWLKLVTPKFNEFYLMATNLRLSTSTKKNKLFERQSLIMYLVNISISQACLCKSCIATTNTTKPITAFYYSLTMMDVIVEEKEN